MARKKTKTTRRVVRKLPTTGTRSKAKPIDADGKTIKVKAVAFSKKPESWERLCLLVAYIIQCRGAATVSEVIDTLLSLHCKVRAGTVSDSVAAMQKSNVLAESHNSDGVRTLSLSRINFNCNPPLSHVEKAIEALRADQAGELILIKLKGDKGPNGEKNAWPTEPADYRIWLHLSRDMLAALPWSSLSLQGRYLAGPEAGMSLHRENGKVKRDSKGNPVMRKQFSDHTEIPLMFDRTHDGKLLLNNVLCILNTFKRIVAAAQPPVERTIRADDVERFFCFKPIEADPKKLSENLLPTIRKETGRDGKGAGAGPKLFESFPAGNTVVLELRAPTKNFITPEEMKSWLERVMDFCPSGLSNARSSSGYGRGVVTKVEVRTWAEWDKGYAEVA